MVFKTHSTIRCDNTHMVYQTFTYQIRWVMVCYDLVHRIRCAKHTFSGQCGITPMVCCSFGVLQCGVAQVERIQYSRYDLEDQKLTSFHATHVRKYLGPYLILGMNYSRLS